MLYYVQKKQDRWLNSDYDSSQDRCDLVLFPIKTMMADGFPFIFPSFWGAEHSASIHKPRLRYCSIPNSSPFQQDNIDTKTPSCLRPHSLTKRPIFLEWFITQRGNCEHKRDTAIHYKCLTWQVVLGSRAHDLISSASSWTMFPPCCSNTNLSFFLENTKLILHFIFFVLATLSVTNGLLLVHRTVGSFCHLNFR